MKFQDFSKRILALLVIAFFCCEARSQQTPGIFFQVTGNGLKDTSYLFGTYHLVNHSYLNEIPAVQKAFNRSKGVVVEVVLDTSDFAAANSAGTMEGDLGEMLDAPFRDSLEAELRKISMTMKQVGNYKPVKVALTLSIIYLIKNNGSVLRKYTGLPLDAYFAKAGAESNKKITALETLEDQMNVLYNSTSIEKQLTELKVFIRNKEQMVQLGNDLVKAWFTGDLARMYHLYEETLTLSGGEDVLLKQRNINWMNLLPGLIQNQSQFIAVGALHLGGKYGIVELLRQKGYTVTAVNTKK